MPFRSNRILHCHESGCGKTFVLDHVLRPGELCPKCGEPFRTRVRFNCGGCNTVYYTDVKRKVGDKFSCPINGEPVVVIRSWQQVAKVVSFVVVPVLVICAGVKLVSSIVPLVAIAAAAITTTVSTIIASVIATLVVVAPLLTWGMVGIEALVIIYLFLHTSVVRPTYFFGEIYRKVQDAPDPTDDLRRLYQLPPEAPGHNVLKETVNKSRDTILKQQLIIGILIIGITVGALFCYMSVKTLEQARQVLQSAILLGGTNVVIFAIIFYSFKFSLQIGIHKKIVSRVWAWVPNEIQKRIRSQTPPENKFLRGVMLSLMFGTATVLTLISLPPILGESVLSGSPIAIALTINVIADVFINSYEVIAILYWKTFVERVHTLGENLQRWLSYESD